MGASTTTTSGNWPASTGRGAAGDERPERRRRDNRDINYFLGIAGNVLAADFEEAATGPFPAPIIP